MYACTHVGEAAGVRQCGTWVCEHLVAKRHRECLHQMLLWFPCQLFCANEGVILTWILELLPKLDVIVSKSHDVESKFPSTLKPAPCGHIILLVIMNNLIPAQDIHEADMRQTISREAQCRFNFVHTCVWYRFSIEWSNLSLTCWIVLMMKGPNFPSLDRWDSMYYAVKESRGQLQVWQWDESLDLSVHNNEMLHEKCWCWLPTVTSLYPNANATSSQALMITSNWIWAPSSVCMQLRGRRAYTPVVITCPVTTKELD